MIQARSKYRRWHVVVVVALVVTGAGVLLYWHWSAGRPYKPAPLNFSGTSDQLQRTVFVPTLDSPMPEGVSVVWCGSFQLAWNRLRDDVARGPVRLENAQTVVERLNRSDLSEDDLSPGAAYAAAGLASDGFTDKVQTEMARRFPNRPKPELDVGPGGAAAYAYLEAAVKFDLPFFDNDEPLVFTDSAGKATSVSSFGIRKKDDYAYGRLRQQVQVLYGDREKVTKDPSGAEFVLDPCKTSKPYQIILARLARKATLADTIALVEERTAANTKLDPYFASLHPLDTILVPNMAWEVTHRFRELEGPDKRFGNPGLNGLHLDAAVQTIRFRLDRSGAELSSESKVYVKPAASYFDFKHPFLIYMRKRDGGRPFFAMWVDNAELLSRK